MSPLSLGHPTPLVLAALVALGGCAGTRDEAPPQPGSGEMLEDLSSAALIHFKGSVPLALRQTYLNLVTQVNLCWGHTHVNGSLTRVWTVEGEFDEAAGTALISLFDPVVGTGVSVASIRLNAEGKRTHIDAMAFRSSAVVKQMGSEQVHLVNLWARGERTACDTP